MLSIFENLLPSKDTRHAATYAFPLLSIFKQRAFHIWNRRAACAYFAGYGPEGSAFCIKFAKEVPHMEPPIPPLLYALLLLIGMLFLMEIGRRFGIRRRPKESEGERGGLGTVEGAVFALFGLMVAFTFSGAATRFNEKRMLIAEEVNCIETAYLRLHLLSPNPNGQARLLK